MKYGVAFGFVSGRFFPENLFISSKEQNKKNSANFKIKKDGVQYKMYQENIFKRKYI